MKSLRILSWNIWLKEKPDNIISFLKQIDADVICCQEVIKHPSEPYHRAEYIAKELGYYYVYACGETWDTKPEKSQLGNAIFSRFPILSIKKVFLKEQVHNPAKAWFEGRVYIEIVIELNQTKYTIATTHLSYTDGFIEDAIKKEEFKKLLPLIKNKNKYLLCGDFNAGAHSEIITSILYYLKNIAPNFSKKKLFRQNHLLMMIFM